MADSFLAYQNPTTTDKKLDSSSLTVGANTVERERIQLAGNSALEIADVKNAVPATTLYGQVVREVALQNSWDSTNNTIGVGGNVANAATDAGKPVKVGGVYNVTPTTLTTGQRGDLQVDASGNLLVKLNTLISGEDQSNLVLGVMTKPLAASTYSPSDDNQMTQVTKRTSKASAGNVFSVYVSNANAALRYFQIHNKATAPVATDVPVLSFPLPAGSATVPGVLLFGNNFWTDGGKYLSTGVSWAISTTYATFTDAATAGEHVVDLKYV